MSDKDPTQHLSPEDQGLQKVVYEAEILSPEAAAASDEFNRLLYVDLGTIDLNEIEATAKKMQAAGVGSDLQAEPVRNRLQQELQYMLGWRPRPDADSPSVTIGVDPSQANKPMTREQREASVNLQRAVMRSLSDSIHRPRKLEKIEKLARFIQEYGISLDLSNKELEVTFYNALFDHKYYGDVLNFIRLADELHVPLPVSTQAYAIEKSISSQLGFVRGIGDEQIQRAEELIAFAADRQLPLDLNANEILQTDMRRGIALAVKGYGDTAAQNVFDFCARHGVHVDTQSRDTTLSESIAEILEHRIHNARNHLDLEALDNAVNFSKTNNIRFPITSDGTIIKFRQDIPRLIEEREWRRKNRF